MQDTDPDGTPPPPSPSPYLPYFDLTPQSFPFPPQTTQTLESRRARLSDDRLLFDSILSSGGLPHPSLHFPPSTPQKLEDLLGKIEGLRFDLLKRDCLVYSLLKWYGDGREEGFREMRCIPVQFAMLSDAYWGLDAGVDVEVG